MYSRDDKNDWGVFSKSILIIVILVIAIMFAVTIESQAQMQQARFVEEPNEVVQKIYLPEVDKIAVIRLVFNEDRFWPQFIMIEDLEEMLRKEISEPRAPLSLKYVPEGEPSELMDNGNGNGGNGFQPETPLTLLPNPGEGKHWEVRETFVAGSMHFVPIVVQDNIFKRYFGDVLKILGGICATVAALFAKKKLWKGNS